MCLMHPSPGHAPAVCAVVYILGFPIPQPCHGHMSEVFFSNINISGHARKQPQNPSVKSFSPLHVVSRCWTPGGVANPCVHLMRALVSVPKGPLCVCCTSAIPPPLCL